MNRKKRLILTDYTNAGRRIGSIHKDSYFLWANIFLYCHSREYTGFFTEENGYTPPFNIGYSLTARTQEDILNSGYQNTRYYLPDTESYAEMNHANPVPGNWEIFVKISGRGYAELSLQIFGWQLLQQRFEGEYDHYEGDTFHKIADMSIQDDGLVRINGEDCGYYDNDIFVQRQRRLLAKS